MNRKYFERKSRRGPIFTWFWAEKPQLINAVPWKQRQLDKYLATMAMFFAITRQWKILCHEATPTPMLFYAVSNEFVAVHCIHVFHRTLLGANCSVLGSCHGLSTHLSWTHCWACMRQRFTQCKRSNAVEFTHNRVLISECYPFTMGKLFDAVGPDLSFCGHVRWMMPFLY